MMTVIRPAVFASFLMLSDPAVSFAQQNAALPDAGCGEVVSVETHDRTSIRYALAHPKAATMQGGPIALVLLVGGGGYLDLDEKGCPRELKGNSLVRSLRLLHQAGFITALIDAPSDHFDDDGLAGFRITKQHADDLGKLIADVRVRTKAAVWLVGTSRGSISAVNAASRLTGPSAPEGVVLTSALMAGQSSSKKAWVAQTVFDLPLEAIRMPILVVGHADDKCIRSPANLLISIIDRTNGSREQAVTVTGGPGMYGSPSIAACEGRSPHGFIDQEAEVVSGITRFIRGGKY